MSEHLSRHYDVIVVGSGAGGSTLAYKLSRAGCRVLVVERGKYLKSQRRSGSDPVGKHRSDLAGKDGEASFVGGLTKFYGSALYRMRESDFGAVEHESGVSPAWPIGYSALAPFYEEAEALYRVHGSPDGDPTEPPRGRPFPYPPIEHDPYVSSIVRRLEQSGTRVSAIPLGIDYGPGGKCVRCSTCDSYFCQLDAKMDAEVAALRPALATGNVELMVGAECARVLTASDGLHVTGVVLRQSDREQIVHADVVAVCAGLQETASLLRRSRTPIHPEGLGNATGCLGRYVAGHSVGLIFPFMGRKHVPQVFTKTFAINRFYNVASGWPYPGGTIQVAGQMPFWNHMPMGARQLVRLIGTHTLMCFYMTEALPTKETGFIFDGDRLVGHTAPVHNLKTFFNLRGLACNIFKQAGYYVLARRRRPYVWHEVGAARFGTDPSISVTDPNCQVHGIKGLFVVDSSVLPSAGALNTALTIIALALRAGNHISEHVN